MMPQSQNEKTTVSSEKSDILDSFEVLEPVYKVALCDRLFAESYEAYYKTAKLLWPRARAKDIKKLSYFLEELKDNPH